MKLYPAIGVYGYPKCGNTWLQGIFSALGQQDDLKYRQDDIYITRKNNTQFKVHPVVTFNGSPCIIFKSHAGYSLDDNALPNKESLGISSLEKVILVKKNPFDVLLSVLNFAGWAIQKASMEGKERPDMHKVIKELTDMDDEQIKAVTSRPDILGSLLEANVCDRALIKFVASRYDVSAFNKMSGSWLSLITSWEEQKDIELLSIRYEDMFFKHQEQLEKISEFLDIPVTNLEQAYNVRQNATHSAHAREVESKKAGFYNKRSAGYFRHYYSAELIQKIFMEEIDIFTRTGYEDILEIC